MNRKVNLTGVRIHDLQIMTVYVHVTKRHVLTTPSVPYMNKNMGPENSTKFPIKPKIHQRYAVLYNLDYTEMHNI